MITDKHKQQIGKAVLAEAVRLSTTDSADWKAASAKLGVNPVHLRYNMQDREKWHNVSETMWRKLAEKLNVKLNEDAWKMADTANSHMMEKYLKEAQNDGTFFSIVAEAAQGKTAACEQYARTAKGGYVQYIKVLESWSHKQFVTELAMAVGVRVDRKMTTTDLIEGILAFFRKQATVGNPLLIIDEAINLRPASLRLIKPLYDELQDVMGCVLVSAWDFHKKLTGFVRNDVAGMDQVESRLGRSYRKLPGLTQPDVVAICNANGVTDEADQQKIWLDMNPQKRVSGKQEYFVATEGLRRLKQLVKRTLSNAKQPA